jgi:hypothetical protein
LLLARRPRWGRLQRQAARALIAFDGEALTGQVAEWAWPRQLLLERRPVTRGATTEYGARGAQHRRCAGPAGWCRVALAAR